MAFCLDAPGLKKGAEGGCTGVGVGVGESRSIIPRGGPTNDNFAVVASCSDVRALVPDERR